MRAVLWHAVSASAARSLNITFEFTDRMVYTGRQMRCDLCKNLIKRKGGYSSEVYSLQYGSLGAQLL